MTDTGEDGNGGRPSIDSVRKTVGERDRRNVETDRWGLVKGLGDVERSGLETGKD